MELKEFHACQMTTTATECVGSDYVIWDGAEVNDVKPAANAGALSFHANYSLRQRPLGGRPVAGKR